MHDSDFFYFSKSQRHDLYFLFLHENFIFKIQNLPSKNYQNGLNSNLIDSFIKK